MKRYDEKLLGLLLDKYERSLISSGKNKVNQSISVKFQKSTFPEYFDESAMQFEVIHDQLEQLEEKGFIRLYWKNKKKGHILEKCELELGHVQDAYQLLHRTPKQKKEEELLKICTSWQGKEEVLDTFLVWMQRRIEERESVQKYADANAPEEFERLCQLIFHIRTNASECFLRQFSIMHFHDSKIAEKDLEKAVHVIAEFSGDGRLKSLQTGEILEEHNIYRNPSWLMMKGNASFQKTGLRECVRIDLRAFPGGLGVSNQDIAGICWPAEVPPEWVVTIENLTSFHQWAPEKDEAALGIYLGGYHNQAKRVFLQNLYQAYPTAAYYHFGDIDCGGFRIWKDLCVKTGIPFRTLFMDQETYENYLAWGRELTEQDRKALALMMEDPFFADQKELFQRMLEKGMKLEQECVGVLLQDEKR